MKKIVLLVAFFITGSLTAQSIEPKYEIEGNLVKATYYHDNGMVKETGYYVDGKVHGKWNSYKEDGSLLMSGEYNNGVKTGKWAINEAGASRKIVFQNNRVLENKTLVAHHRK